MAGARRGAGHPVRRRRAPPRGPVIPPSWRRRAENGSSERASPSSLHGSRSRTGAPLRSRYAVRVGPGRAAGRCGRARLPPPSGPGRSVVGTLLGGLATRQGMHLHGHQRRGVAMANSASVIISAPVTTATVSGSAVYRGPIVGNPAWSAATTMRSSPHVARRSGSSRRAPRFPGPDRGRGPAPPPPGGPAAKGRGAWSAGHRPQAPAPEPACRLGSSRRRTRRSAGMARTRTVSSGT